MDVDAAGGVALRHLHVDHGRGLLVHGLGLLADGLVLGTVAVHPRSALQSGEQRGVDGDGLLPSEFLGDLAGQHVDPSLVDSGVSDIDSELEHVDALHEGVDDLGGVQLCLVLLPSHDGHGPLDPGKGGDLSDLDDVLPVGEVVDDVLRVPELHLVGGYSESDEAVLHVPGDRTDVVEVSSHLVVDGCMPVGPEDDYLESRVAEILDLCGDQRPSHVDDSGWLETDIGQRLLLGLQDGPELFLAHDFHRIPFDKRKSLFHCHAV